MSDSTASLKPVSGFKFDPAGHVKFADGSMIQWGTTTATPEGTPVLFDVPYAVELSGVAGGAAESRPDAIAVTVSASNISGFVASAAAPVAIGYIAVGR